MLVEGYVEVGKGVTLFTSQGGAPSWGSLLVIHGGPDWDHSYLRWPLELLTDRVHLVMPDLRGCGRSTRGLPRELYTPDAVVADLLALLEALGMPKAAVLGFSYGGLLAQRLTCAAPQRVSRLIVASSSVYPVDERSFGDWAARDQAQAEEAAVWREGASGGAELTKAAAVAGVASNVYRSEARADYLDRVNQVRFSDDWHQARLAGTLPSPRLPDPAAALAATGVPTLLLHGRQDMIFPAALAERAAMRLPAAQAHVIEDAGHMAHIDQPGQWLTAVQQFLLDR